MVLALTFDSKVALVTGGSSGIGRSTALTFAKYGASVVVADIDDLQGEATAKEIIGNGGKSIFVMTDVTKSQNCQDLIEKVVATYGRLDYGFNNAGVNKADNKFIHEYSEADWDRVIDINLKSVWLSMKYEIIQMLVQGFGCIVNTASIAGLIGMPGACSYVAAKHGVIGLTKTAALEYAKSGTSR